MTLMFPAPSSDDSVQRRGLREALSDAVLQDFIDDLPVPTRPSDLATRLLYPRWQVYSDIHEGKLIAERVRRNTRLLKVDVERNREWIAHGLATRRARAGSVVDAPEQETPVSVVIVDPEALAQLHAITASGLSIREAVEHALRSIATPPEAEVEVERRVIPPVAEMLPGLDARRRQARVG